MSSNNYFDLFLFRAVIKYLTSDYVLTNATDSKLTIANQLKCQSYAEIRTEMNRIFPRASIHFYGSRFYGLADENSDLNIFVDVGMLKILTKEFNFIEFYV